MSRRSYINNKILLCGESNGKRFPRTFKINDKVDSDSEGAYVVCYEASYDRSGVGVLKEFYPLNVYSLTRNNNGQLIHKEGMTEDIKKFNQLLDEYIEPYNTLLEVRKQRELATFIPHFEIYYGCDENCNPVGTVYIWTPEPKLKTFDKVCREIRQKPDNRPQYNLVQILYSIESLVKCVCALHNNNLIHRDIKPDNFGFAERGGDLLTQSISLFDINTICSVYNVKDDCAIGTEGYMEPEILNFKANNLTDIFSIGASLFQAIAVTKETKADDCRYKYEYFKRIDTLVEESELIKAAESELHPYFKNILIKILKKTLCSRDERYQSCEELLKDVQKALYYVVPAEISERGESGVKWVLADVDKYFDKTKEKNTSIALMYHLYKEPLYANVPQEKKDLDILVIGFGMYGRKFLDIILPIAQMPDKKLNITVIASSCKDKDEYLRLRPQLSDFFDIDGSVSHEKDNYGTIRFLEHKFSLEEQNADYYLKSLYNDKQPDYTFISIGKNTDNMKLALMTGFSTIVCPVHEGKHINGKKMKGIEPVYVSMDVSSEPVFKEIERMAFNVHLLWNKNINIKLANLKKEFRKPYNYRSCIYFVIAMKYKLYGIGIALNNDNIIETAEKFAEYINSDEKQKNELICFEHKRWVAEKLCLGYSQITDINECSSGLMKDEKKKRHLCIVRSDTDCALSAGEWIEKHSGNPNKIIWDNPPKALLESLDELDRVSVELHLLHKKNAQIEKKSGLLNGDTISAIHNLIDCDNECVFAYQELINCMKDVWNEDSERWKCYEGLRKKFISAVNNSDKLIERSKKSIIKLIDSVNERFYPIFASQQFRDYKKDDIKLIEEIPFILTYSENICMTIPYAKGTKTQLFNNFASAAVVNPSKIIYTFYCSEFREFEAIKETLTYMAEYMKNRELQTNVEFILGYKSKIGNQPDIEKDFSVLSGNRVKKVRLIQADDINTFAVSLKEHLIRRSRQSRSLFAEKNNTELSAAMERNGIYNELSGYSYCSRKMKFNDINKCSVLKYISGRPYITVKDMFSLKISPDKTYTKPEFYRDYKQLWNKYLSLTDKWKKMCCVLSGYSEYNDEIGRFSRKARENEKCEYTYIIPFVCKKAVSKVIDILINEGIAELSSCINNLTTDACEVIIKDKNNNKEEYDRLFSKPYMLMREEYISCRSDREQHIVRVLYNNLTVSSLECREKDKDFHSLLEFFKEIRYITNLFYNKEREEISFTYATPQIKDLLTTEKRIIEIYTYHKAKETGYFDDIRCSSEIDMPFNTAENSFDFVMTKGFSSLFVQCVTDNNSAEQRKRMNEVSEQYGINAVTAIITDETIVPDAKSSKKSDNVVNISDVTDIGKKLIGIIS